MWMAGQVWPAAWERSPPAERKVKDKLFALLAGWGTWRGATFQVTPTSSTQPDGFSGVTSTKWGPDPPRNAVPQYLLSKTCVQPCGSPISWLCLDLPAPRRSSKIQKPQHDENLKPNLNPLPPKHEKLKSPSEAGRWRRRRAQIG